MKMEHYLCHTDYPIWYVIHNNNGPVSVTTDTNGMIKVLPPKTAEEVVAREKERKARTTLLMALPEDHLVKFHKMADAKEMWEPMKSRFGGNDESKKMQNFDNLYNNLGVFKRDVKGTTASSSSNTHNEAFVSAENTSSTNTVSTTCSVSSPSVSKSQQEGSSLYTDEVIHSFFANQSSAPQLDCDDLEQINDDDLEKIDFKWQNQDSRRRDGRYNGNKARENSRRPAYQDDSKPLVTMDGEEIDWSGHVEEDTQNFAMMAYSSCNSGSDNEKECNLENTPINDRYAKGMHAVLPHMTGNYMPSGPDVDIDYSKFTYGPKQTSADESDSKPVENASSDSDSSVEPSTSVPEPVVNESKASEPKAVSEPKVWTDAPIIEEYESDSDDDFMSNIPEEKEKPSFAFTDTVKHVKSPKENVKGTPNHYSKIEKQDRHSHTRKGLGYTRKSCFVCGSFSHLIRDCDFHEKRMAKQAALTISKKQVTG
nr:xylulose kinase-1 [Tanacetum cinerariifolium]